MIVIPYKPTVKQKELHDDQTRFKVAVWGRRSGKSTYAINEAIKTCIVKPESKVWIIAPTYGQAKDIYWRGNDMLDKYLPAEVYDKKNDTELLIEFKNKSILQFKGADRPEVMRGSALDLVILDEIAEHRYAKDTWEKVLMPSLSDKQGKAIFIGTPKGYNYFYDLYKLGLGENTFWKSWKIATWESGAPWTLTEAGKYELEQAKNNMTEDAFYQEYGADFRKYTGLVFKDFDISKHVKEFEIKQEYPLECGMDFGWQNPTVFLATYFDNDDNWYVIDEHYEKQKPIIDHTGMILALRNKYKNSQRFVVGDSANQQEINEFAQNGLYITPVEKVAHSIQTGISRISERLKINPITREPRLFIHPRCKNLIYELERYKWIENKSEGMNEKDVPEKSFDHAIDALRYIILHHTKDKTQEINSEVDTYKPAGGYIKF